MVGFSLWNHLHYHSCCIHEDAECRPNVFLIRTFPTLVTVFLWQRLLSIAGPNDYPTWIMQLLFPRRRSDNKFFKSSPDYYERVVVGLLFFCIIHRAMLVGILHLLCGKRYFHIKERPFSPRKWRVPHGWFHASAHKRCFERVLSSFIISSQDGKIYPADLCNKP